MDKKELQEKAKKQLQDAKNAVKNIKLPDQVKNVFNKKGAKADNGEVAEIEKAKAVIPEEEVKEEPQKEEETVAAEEKKHESKEEEHAIKAISTKNAIKIFYYLMAVDGEVFHSEDEKFDEIGIEIDPNFAEHKAGIISECKAQMDKVIDPEDYYDVIQDGVEEAILIPDTTADSFITPKLLVWDLLTIAYSDEKYDEKERKLLKYIVRKFNIDAAIFLEMENTLQTLMDLEKELNWIKTTNKPYLTIEAHVNELQDRKNCIFESVKDLIKL